MTLWPSDDLQDLPFLYPIYRKAQKWKRKNLIWFVFFFLILWISGLSLSFLLDSVESLHEGFCVFRPFPIALRKPAMHKALLCRHFQHFPAALRCHQQISAGSQTTWRHQAGPEGPLGLVKLQQECPWFRGNLRAYLVDAAESISRVSWMQGGKLSNAETISTKPFYHVGIFTISLELCNCHSTETWEPWWWAFLCWWIHRKNFCLILLFLLVSKQQWKLCSFQNFRGIFCV